MRLATAVFPVAGARPAFVPEGAPPIEMAPILDRPLIQIAVEEAAAAGCRRLVFVGRPGDDALMRYFDSAPERHLAAFGGPPGPERIHLTQASGRGLGRAILCAREAIGDAPFAVILPDDLVTADPPALAQLASHYEDRGGAMIAGIEVPREEVGRYGIMRIEDTGGDVVRVVGLEEKPDSDATMSNFSITGRYILPPEIFDALEETPLDENGALQLTDALARLVGRTPVWAARYQGERFDCGALSGFVRATIAQAAGREALRPDAVRYMRRTLERLQRRGGT